MNAIYNKIIGYILLAAGLGMIFWGVFSAYGIYNGQNPAPEIFKIENKNTPVSSDNQKLNINSNNPGEIQSQMQQAIGNEIGTQLKEALPLDFLPKMMNLASWSIFIGILIFAGSQVSSLGIKLLKD